MHLGSIYLIVKSFEQSVAFYEALLERPVSSKNMERFAQFEFEGHNISLMNGYFDAQHPNLTEHRGDYIELFDDLVSIAEAENTHKVVLNFWVEDLEKEWNRLKELGIGNHLTQIKYVCNVMPYYYFQLTDPDGNVIEVTGKYEEEQSKGESFRGICV